MRDRPWRRPAAVAGLLAALLPASAARTADADLESLIAYERAFASMSVEKGMREAFLTHLADRSVLFRPRPVDGRAWFVAQPAAHGVLSWLPTFADVSAGGDLGYTAGPFEYSEKLTDSTRSAYGHFVSVWQRQGDGQWKVVADLGIAHERPEPAMMEPRFADRPLRTTTHHGVDPRSERAALTRADRDLCGACADLGAIAAYDPRLGAGARVFRNGRYPAVGHDQGIAAVAGDGKMRCRPLSADVARTGDLGYTYGEIERPALRGARTARPDSLSYLRVWRRGDDGGWRLALDITVPIPRMERAGPEKR